MRSLEIENEQREEFIRYYYVAKKEMTKETFVTHVNEREGLNIIVKGNLPGIDSDILEMTDLKDFFDKEMNGELKLSGCTIENEWNRKICFIETTDHYVMRIWETTA